MDLRQSLVDPWGTRWVHYGHLSNGGWTGYKSDICEGGHRVPFIARWPGRIPAGRSSDEVICPVDLMATAAALTGQCWQRPEIEHRLHRLLDDCRERGRSRP